MFWVNCSHLAVNQEGFKFQLIQNYRRKSFCAYVLEVYYLDCLGSANYDRFTSLPFLFKSFPKIYSTEASVKIWSIFLMSLLRCLVKQRKHFILLAVGMISTWHFGGITKLLLILHYCWVTASDHRSPLAWGEARHAQFSWCTMFTKVSAAWKW